MNQKTIDTRRKLSADFMATANERLSAGFHQQALKAAFYAGIKEAEAQQGEEELECENFCRRAITLQSRPMSGNMFQRRSHE